jgi:hypothetical protein
MGARRTREKWSGLVDEAAGVPRDRYLELAPKHWPTARARLSPKELELPFGHITVPPPLPKEQPSPN